MFFASSSFSISFISSFISHSETCSEDSMLSLDSTGDSSISSILPIVSISSVLTSI